MQYRNYIRNLVAWPLMLFTAACWASPRDLTVAEVHVFQEQLAGKVRYTYVVTNKGAAPITGLEVGFGYFAGKGTRRPGPTASASLVAQWPFTRSYRTAT